MLSIGEFSKICQVSTKTLRYYAQIGLIQPEEINPENGYRYYTIDQLKQMIFINRLKSYHFSLEEIKALLLSNETLDNTLLMALQLKKKEMESHVEKLNETLAQLATDVTNLQQGKSIMTYLENIHVELVEVPTMHILFVRKMVPENGFPETYRNCFNTLLKQIANEKLTILAPPMVLFHSSEFTPFGFDTEFAIPIKEEVQGSRDFTPGLCLKTVVHGSYSQLSSVYTKHIEWAENEGYECTNALYEVYVTDPSEVSKESDLVTEVYYPIKKK